MKIFLTAAAAALLSAGCGHLQPSRGPQSTPAPDAPPPSIQEIQRHYPRNVGDLFAASKNALWNAKWTVESESIAGAEARLRGRSLSGIQCTITLTRVQLGKTRAAVQVRTQTDQDALRIAKDLHAGIAATLGSPADERDP